MKRTPGIVVRHSRTCATQTNKDANCNCKPSYRAEVYDKRLGTKRRATFSNLDEARGWRHDTASKMRAGTLATPTKQTLREVGEALIAGMETGAIRTRSGDPYKPSAIRSYESALKERVYESLGTMRLSEIQRRDLQRLADDMLARKLSPSTIRNALMPLRVIFRRALEDGHANVNPTERLRLPAVRGTRDRIAAPDEAADLIAALPLNDRALWATAMYAGLRRGELMGLRVEDVDLARGVIRVERAYDPKAQTFVEPKSRAGKRAVPIASALRDFLVEHKLRLGRSDGLFFGRSASLPFMDTSLAARAHTAWKKANKARAEKELAPLEPIGLHEARHTFASLMIAAGVNAKALSAYMGHANISMTIDRYGHLMPGNENEAAALLDAYLERADTKARLAQV